MFASESRLSLSGLLTFILQFTVWVKNIIMVLVYFPMYYLLAAVSFEPFLLLLLMGGLVAFVTVRASDFRPIGCVAIKQQVYASCSHPRDSIIVHYNLVPVN